jgi:tetratricopeptide (TPR) repeat protein
MQRVAVGFKLNGDVDGAIGIYKAELPNWGCAKAVTEAYDEKGDIDEAIHFWKSQLQTGDFESMAWHELARAMSIKGDIDGAIEISAAAPFRFQDQLTELFKAKGDIHAEIKFWESKRALNDYGLAAGRLVEVWNANGEADKVMAICKEELSKRVPMLQPRLAHRLTQALTMKGETEQAIKFWQSKLTDYPGDGIALRQLANSFLAAGDQDGVLQLCRENPSCWMLEHFLTDVYKRRRDLDGAVEYWKTQLASNWPEKAAMELAYALNVKGDIGAEIAFWKECYIKGDQWRGPMYRADRRKAQIFLRYLIRAFKKNGSIDETIEFWKEQFVDGQHWLWKSTAQR